MVVNGVSMYSPPAVVKVPSPVSVNSPVTAHKAVYSHRAVHAPKAVYSHSAVHLQDGGWHPPCPRQSDQADQQLQVALAPTSLKLHCLMHILLHPAQKLLSGNAVCIAG